MYLNGTRLREVARLRKLSKEDIEQQSGLSASDIAYYWNNPVTVAGRKDVDALAKLLGVNADSLLVSGEPENAMLRPDKFVSHESDITFVKQQKKEVK